MLNVGGRLSTARFLTKTHQEQGPTEREPRSQCKLQLPLYSRTKSLQAFDLTLHGQRLQMCFPGAKWVSFSQGTAAASQVGRLEPALEARPVLRCSHSHGELPIQNTPTLIKTLCSQHKNATQ
jgi:hypothetical protein